MSHNIVRVYFRQVVRDYISKNLTGKQFTIRDFEQPAKVWGKKIGLIYAEIYALHHRGEIAKVGEIEGAFERGRQHTLTVYEVVRILPPQTKVSKATGEIKICNLHQSPKITRRRQQYKEFNELFLFMTTRGVYEHSRKEFSN